MQSIELSLNIDTSSSNNTQTVKMGDTDMEDKDPEDALRTLSNMKRYKISSFCHLNFFMLDCPSLAPAWKKTVDGYMCCKYKREKRLER